jgi:uncharacterized protein YvpB
MKAKKKFILSLIIILVLFLILFFVFEKKYDSPTIVSKTENINSSNSSLIQQEVNNEIQSENNVIAENISQSLETKLPDKVLLDVPFVEQAPMRIWDALHEDACEEASLITVENFINKKEAGSAKEQEKEIQDLVKYETKNGYASSITLDQLNKLAADYYNLKTGRVGKNITADDIKKELASGKPVIVGAAGKVLPNPNFKNGGPNYHMLVVIGYDQNGFIANDPGTKKGKSFRYTFDGLFNAIHDWNAKNILNGGKNYLVFD